ncbi:MAG: VWA domain-containing protein [Saprospiraceae bacterium]|nr:VWA domain-containing protein [Saprospiraceae bacterium]
MKPIYVFLLLLFAFPTILPASTNHPPANILVILDASGSMWQKLEGEYKITTAKKVLKNLVAQLPDDARIGLVAYGHKSKSDCADIETLMPLERLNKTSFTAKIDAINPLGKTPIAKSINHTLALIRSEKEPVTIVLISDGLETCEGNACDLVQKAKGQGVHITVHVVGFGIEEKDQSPLECIAQAGEGQYLPANNANELNEALIKTVEAPPAQGGYLSVKATQGENLMDATIKVFKKGETKELLTGRTYTGEQTNPRIMLLPAGEYIASVTSVTMDGKPTQTLADIRIVENDTIYKMVDFAQGTFEIRVTRNGVLSDATIGIYKKGESGTTAQGRSYNSASHNPARYQILPGTYDIEIGGLEIAGKPTKRFESQTLVGGGMISLSHNFESGEIKIGARKGAELVDATVSIFRNGKSVASGRTYTDVKNNPKSFVLEPGKYRVDLKPVKPAGLAVKSVDVEIKIGETVSKMLEW